MTKIPQKHQRSHFSLLCTSEYTNVTELHEIVMELHLWNKANYVRYKNT